MKVTRSRSSDWHIYRCWLMATSGFRADGRGSRWEDTEQKRRQHQHHTANQVSKPPTTNPSSIIWRLNWGFKKEIFLIEARSSSARITKHLNFMQFKSYYKLRSAERAATSFFLSFFLSFFAPSFLSLFIPSLLPTFLSFHRYPSCFSDIHVGLVPISKFYQSIIRESVNEMLINKPSMNEKLII